MHNGASAEKVEAVLGDYQKSRLFSPRERSALELAERMTYTRKLVSESFFKRLKKQFTDEELVELAATIALENFRSKFNPVFGIESQGFCPLPAVRTASAAAAERLRSRKVSVIQVKRIYEKPARSDGARFLVDRLWPRGLLKKESLHLEDWLKEVAPSDALRRWFGHDPKKWKQFRRRYFAELDGEPEAWKPLLEAARRKAVMLLYSAKDPEHNNAAALRDYLMKKLGRG